jgi:hypothetical protein
VAKLSIPLAYNFMTFLSPSIYHQTIFYGFLGRLINLTPLGSWFDFLFPIFILVPVSATLFNLYGRVKRLVGFGVIDDDDEEDNEIGFGTGSWREGRDLIERELTGHSSLSHLRDGTSSAAPLPSTYSHTRAPTTNASSTSAPVPQPSNAPLRAQPHQPLPPAREPEEENFFEALAHRARNTLDTVQTPKWLQSNKGGGFKRPKWLGGSDAIPDGDGDSGGDASAAGTATRPPAGGRSGSSFLSLFGGRGNEGGEGRIRL